MSDGAYFVLQHKLSTQGCNLSHFMLENKHYWKMSIETEQIQLFKRETFHDKHVMINRWKRYTVTWQSSISVTSTDDATGYPQTKHPAGVSKLRRKSEDCSKNTSRAMICNQATKAAGCCVSSKTRKQDFSWYVDCV